MRVTSFRGMRPRADIRQPEAQAALAENVDFYSRALQPLRKPSYHASLVDLCGRPFSGEARYFMRVGSYYVGLIDHTPHVVDPTGRGVLFVQDGKLWRTREDMLRYNICPALVGVGRPDKALTATVLAGAGCKVWWPPHECAPTDCEDKDADPGHITAYRYTFVNDCNEEGPPSEPSDPVDVKNGDVVAVTRHDTNADEYGKATRWRLYRSVVTTEAKVAWLFVDEIPIAETVYIDRKCPLELGEALATERADPPPCGLEGVALTRNMQVAVWGGTDFWISRCDSVALYPQKMHTRLPDPIMFMAGYTTVAEQDTHFEISAVTTRFPYAIEVEDDMPHVREIPLPMPALSRTAYGLYHGGVVYASTEGVVHLVQGQAQYLTANYLTAREWAAYSPEHTRYAQWGERLLVFGFKGHERRGILFGFGLKTDVREGDMTEVTLSVKDMRSDVNTVQLLIGNDVYLWQGSSEPMLMRWRSFDAIQTGWAFPTTIKVEGDLPRRDRGLMQAQAMFNDWRKLNPTAEPDTFFDSHCHLRRYASALLQPLTGARITVFIDGKPLFTRPLYRQDPMRLPRKRNGITWAFEVQSYDKITEIHMQTATYDMVQDGGHA